MDDSSKEVRKKFDDKKPKAWLKARDEAEKKELEKKEKEKVTKALKRAEKLSGRFEDWSFPYDKSLDSKFFALAEAGESLTRIAYLLQIPKKVLLGWSTDDRKKSFNRAFEAAKEAYQAFHEGLHNDMVQGRIPKVSAKQIDAQANLLKVMFQEDWAPIQKQELEITTNQLDGKEIDDKLRHLLESDHIRSHLKKMAERDFKPDIKEVGKDNE